MGHPDKDAAFVAGVEEVIAGFPPFANTRIGYAIRLAQQGKKADYTHPLTGRAFRGAKVFEIDVSFNMSEHRMGRKIELASLNDNVFARLGVEDPDEEALKVDLAVALMRAIDELGITRVEAAERIGIRPAELNRLVGGYLEDFTSPAILDYVGRLGFTVASNSDMIPARSD